MGIKESVWKKMLKAFLVMLLVLVLVIVGYFAYVFIDYYRIDDNQKLDIKDNVSEVCAVGKEYKIISYNVGFGAYTPDFGFFMDGGTESRAASADSVKEDLQKITDFLQGEDPDFALIEEVDIDSTRAWHVNEKEILENAMTGYDSLIGVNYDSPYLFYPFLEPHGKSLAGIMTFSKFNITSSIRRQLPIEESLMKLVDLDRCYTVSRIPTDDGKELVLYTFHLSAYTSDGTICTEQLKMLINDMEEEYKKGNYCIAGGDFNKDILGDEEETSADIFGVDGSEYTWAQVIPSEMFENTPISKIVPFDEENMVPSCRNADGPYTDEQFVVTVDGFLTSPNVTVLTANVYDTGFQYSDHNPVYMNFVLGGPDYES